MISQVMAERIKKAEKELNKLLRYGYDTEISISFGHNKPFVDIKVVKVSRASGKTTVEKAHTELLEHNTFEGMFSKITEVFKKEFSDYMISKKYSRIQAYIKAKDKITEGNPFMWYDAKKGLIYLYQYDCITTIALVEDEFTEDDIDEIVASLESDGYTFYINNEDADFYFQMKYDMETLIIHGEEYLDFKKLGLIILRSRVNSYETVSNFEDVLDKLAKNTTL